MISDDLYEYVHSEKDLPSDSFRTFQNMKQKRQLCDLTVKCQSTSISVHRVVLAATIPYFHGMLTTGFREGPEKNVFLEEMDPRSLETFVNFAYGCSVKITNENAESLLKASTYLGLTDIRDVCCKLLSKHLNSSNVIRTMNLAGTLDCASLSEACDTYICKKFEIISNSKEFINLPFTSLQKIVVRDDLSVLSEQPVFEAIMKWVKGRGRDRKIMLPDLLVRIRMAFLTPEYLIENVDTEGLIKNSLACRDVIQQAKNYHLLHGKRSEFVKFSVEPRKYKNVHGHGVYVFCYKEHCGLSVNYYNSDGNKWVKLVTANPRGRNQLHKFAYYAANEDNDIYAVGDSCSEVLNVKTLEWTPCELLKKPPFRCCQIVFADNKIYYFDGVFPSKLHCFDLKQNVWLRKSSMKINRHSVGAAALGDYIYVTGGVLQEWHEASNVSHRVERYHRQAREWAEVSPMLSKRYSHGCASLNEKIYSCGGGEFEIFNTAELYDPLTDHWSYISSMIFPRISFSLVAYNGKLYAFDSPITEGRSYTHNMEVYDPAGNKWELGPPIVCQHDSEASVTGVASTVRAVVVPTD